jgi:2-polyprenyl-3-methyl-5-hydroxy-6-metoxy-1,4-benzoquinol methylase
VPCGGDRSRGTGGTGTSGATDVLVDLSPPIHEGVVHAAYANPRDEVAALVPPTAHRVLDVGCSTGHLGEALRKRGHNVVGLEVDPTLASMARGRLATVIEADVESLADSEAKLDGSFDCVVMADVLEHLRDPWAVVRWAVSLLSPTGCVVISVPNIRHARTFWNVAVRRRWPVEEVGIFDRTHLRFFARRNLADLLAGTDLRITEVRRTYLLVSDWNSRWNRLAPYLGDLGTLQFVFRADLPGAA